MTNIALAKLLDTRADTLMQMSDDAPQGSKVRDAAWDAAKDCRNAAASLRSVAAHLTAETDEALTRAFGESAEATRVDASLDCPVPGCAQPRGHAGVCRY